MGEELGKAEVLSEEYDKKLAELKKDCIHSKSKWGMICRTTSTLDEVLVCSDCGTWLKTRHRKFGGIPYHDWNEQIHNNKKKPQWKIQNVTLEKSGEEEEG